MKLFTILAATASFLTPTVVQALCHCGSLTSTSDTDAIPILHDNTCHNVTLTCSGIMDLEIVEDSCYSEFYSTADCNGAPRNIVNPNSLLTNPNGEVHNVGKAHVTLGEFRAGDVKSYRSRKEGREHARDLHACYLST
ncbi:hypothetical protein BCR34DRAFT_606747 [Clohesyomyces aquaticus]|uniref:Cyanovirin-N domain-containing protein n=1 Tax=Clohesyomyces aquaticus TaxID=1231657 RepID=A0A1Y1YN83_9PLEO|nr:hypothetical protein BCR34DRAFT_606747 [Clohesyomyces aquaticus]